MYVDVPQFKRCCFCLSLRHGLLVWGYFKLLSSLLCLLLFVEQTLSLNNTAVGNFCIIITNDIVLVVDTCFNILFIVGAHLKRYKFLRVYYWYGVVTLAINAALIFLFIGMFFYALSQSEFRAIYLLQGAGVLCTAILSWVLQLYLQLLIRSQVFKLKTNLQFKFVNVTIGGDANDEKEIQEKIMYGRMSDNDVDDRYIV